MRSQRRQEEVTVHDDMNQGVHEAAISGVTTGSQFEEQPGCDGHGGVVINMEERHVAVLFPQHEEESVNPVDVLADVVRISRKCFPQFVFVAEQEARCVVLVVEPAQPATHTKDDGV